MAMVNVLIPMYKRRPGRAVASASLLSHPFAEVNVGASDQMADVESHPDCIEIRTPVRALRRCGHRVGLHRHRLRGGVAER